MKVNALIKRLQKMNPNATVKLHGRFGEEVLFVLALQNDDKDIWLETESDANLGEEIEARLEDAKEGKVDIVEVYTGLLELGIGTDLVEKYIGKDEASQMREVCQRNGLEV